MYARLILLSVLLAACDCGASPAEHCSSDAECSGGAICLDGTCQGGPDAGGDGAPADTGDAGEEDSRVDGEACDVPCGDVCCADGKLCRADRCFNEQDCTGHNDCQEDSFCDADGFCTPYDEGEHDDRCEREAVGPDRFLAAIQCAYTEAPEGDAAPTQIEAHGTPLVIDLNMDNDPDTRHPSVIWIGNNVGGGPCVGRHR